MIIIGILGGVASGKSLVSDRLAELGAEILDADVVAHAVLKEDDIKAAIGERFGNNVFDETGEIQRKKLAEMVFAPGDEGARALADLERITHPRIGERIRQHLEYFEQAGRPVVVLDAAVMMKAGWHKICDILLFVEAKRRVRQQRAAQRGWSPEQFAAREAAQVSLVKKRDAADFVIDNCGAPQNTYAQIDRFWKSFVRPANTNEEKITSG